MATYVKVAGVWKEVTSDSPSNGVCGYVKVNGTWRTVNQSYVRINGVWRSVCTAPGQQPAPIPESICYRPNYCLNGTNGVILPTTEPCYMPDGVTLGTRTAPYTCQTDPGCISYTVPAGTCTVPDPIISVVSEEIGDCEFWGGLSGCTGGNAKRITRRMSDNSVKVSYSCCDPLQPNLKYYCTLRPYTTGQCLNELKDTDFTGVVIAGQGEWVCEALGVTSFPSCSTAENCSVPKTSTATTEPCGYLNTGQRTVTTNTYQSWCDKTIETVIGDCIGADDPCSGKYCGEGSGEEQYATSNCASGYGIRYKCLTPEGCNTVYTFRRCVPVPPPCGGGTIYQITSVVWTNSSKTTVSSCQQYTSCSVPNPINALNDVYSSTSGQFQPCPTSSPPDTGGIVNPPGVNCTTCVENYSVACTTTSGQPGSQNVCVTAPECEDLYGSCVEVAGGCDSCIQSDTLACDCPDGSVSSYTICTTPGDCPNIETPCNCPDTGSSGANCSSCEYGSGTESCGSGGTRSYCITPVGCPNIYGPCVGEAATTNPEEPAVSNPTGATYTTTGSTTYEPGPTSDSGGSTTWETTPTTDGGNELVLVDDTTGATIGDPIYIPDLSGLTNPKVISINVDTPVRTKDGLVPAYDLKVGDKLLSADIETFPYDNLLTSNMDLLEWVAQNPHINLVETEIVNIRKRVAEWAVIVDGEAFSDTHYILVNRNDNAQFVKSMDLEPNDLIWSHTYHSWVRIGRLVKVDVRHEVVSIDCEPYDIFFTERMLTHDSHSVD